MPLIFSSFSSQFLFPYKRRNCASEILLFRWIISHLKHSTHFWLKISSVFLCGCSHWMVVPVEISFLLQWLVLMSQYWLLCNMCDQTNNEPNHESNKILDALGRSCHADIMSLIHFRWFTSPLWMTHTRTHSLMPDHHSVKRPINVNQGTQSTGQSTGGGNSVITGRVCTSVWKLRREVWNASHRGEKNVPWRSWNCRCRLC